jgi:hypothetical protein
MRLGASDRIEPQACCVRERQERGRLVWPRLPSFLRSSSLFSLQPHGVGNFIMNFGTAVQEGAKAV